MVFTFKINKEILIMLDGQLLTRRPSANTDRAATLLVVVVLKLHLYGLVYLWHGLNRQYRPKQLF